jgi:hypothetical protein
VIGKLRIDVGFWRGISEHECLVMYRDRESVRREQFHQRRWIVPGKQSAAWVLAKDPGDKGGTHPSLLGQGTLPQPCREHDPAARPQYPRHLRRRSLRIRRENDTEHRHDRVGRFGLHFAGSLGRALLDGRVEEVGEVRQSGTLVGRQIAERGGDQ